MDIFETLSSKLSFTGKEAKRKAKELTDIAKLNSSIYKENAKLKELYYGLGQLYYNKHKDEPEDEFGLMIRNITASLETIGELKDKVQQVKNESEAQKKANAEANEDFFSEDAAPVDAPISDDDISLASETVVSDEHEDSTTEQDKDPDMENDIQRASEKTTDAHAEV